MKAKKTEVLTFVELADLRVEANLDVVGVRVGREAARLHSHERRDHAVLVGARRVAQHDAVPDRRRELQPTATHLFERLERFDRLAVASVRVCNEAVALAIQNRLCRAHALAHILDHRHVAASRIATQQQIEDRGVGTQRSLGRSFQNVLGDF